MQNSVSFSGEKCPSTIIVLADDITGAAEIAGIAHSYGLKTKLSTTIGTCADGCDVLVLATDWRQMTESDAMTESYRATAFYRESLSKKCAHPIFFKKTDSVLRGHILAECQGMLTALNENDNHDNLFRVLLIPQNPSKGRVVRNGFYYINDKPIVETSFSFDPEYPAKSSVVAEILQNNLQDKSLSVDIETKDAETIEEINDIVSNHLKSPSKDYENIIFAGGADLFSSTLSIYHNLCANFKNEVEEEDSPEKAIIVCGSTQSTDISETKFCKDNDFVLTTMPVAVFHGEENPDVWTNDLKQIYRDHNLILTIGHKPQGGQAYAIRLRNLMANAIKILSTDSATKDISNSSAKFFADSSPDLLIIEGGATAYQILQTLGWCEFLVYKEFAPGVVGLKYKRHCTVSKYKSSYLKETTIILKPGSYPWGNLF